MVMLDTRPPGENIEPALLKDRVSREVARIVAAAEKSGPAQPARPEIAGWSYRIPFAGVRYYGYHP